jgi:hypothetical protein
MQYREYAKKIFKDRSKEIPAAFFAPTISYLVEPSTEAAEARAQQLARSRDGNRYLVENSRTAAQARSAELWQMVQCQPQPACDPITKYMLDVVSLADGSGALVVRQEMNPTNFQTLVDGRKSALTEDEILRLQTATQIGATLTERNASQIVTLTDGTSAIIVPKGADLGLTKAEMEALETGDQLGSLRPLH